MLADPARCQVVLVTLPETTPVNELIETAYALEERVGVQLGPVVVNGVDDGARPAIGDASPDGTADRTRPTFRNERRAAARDASWPGWRPTSRSRRSCCRDVVRPASTPAERRRSSSTRRCVDAGRGMRAMSSSRGASASAEVIVCCGSGGVGKTTTAAALGAARGRASAGGSSSSRSTRRSGWPTRSACRAGSPTSRARLADRRRPAGHGGELWAMMLDTGATFDDLVRPTPPTPSRRSGSSPTASTATSPARCQRHAGVHGRREAPRAARRRPLRPRRSSTRRRPATRSTSSRRRGRWPASSTTRCSGC